MEQHAPTVAGVHEAEEQHTSTMAGVHEAVINISGDRYLHIGIFLKP
jgi:hypothetical protein